MLQKINIQLLPHEVVQGFIDKGVGDGLFGLVLVGRHGRGAVDDNDQTVRNVRKGNARFGFVVFAGIPQVFVDFIGKSALDRTVRRAAVLQKTGVVVVFHHFDGIGEAEGDVRLQLVLRLVLPITPLRFQVPEHRRCQTVLPDGFRDVVGNAVFIEEFLFLRLACLVHDAQNKVHPCVDHRLPVQHVFEEFGRNGNVGKNFPVGAPANDRPGRLLLRTERALFQFADRFAALEMNLTHKIPVVRGDIHEFRAVLRGAGAQTVQAQGIFVGGLA